MLVFWLQRPSPSQQSENEPSEGEGGTSEYSSPNASLRLPVCVKNVMCVAVCRVAVTKGADCVGLYVQLTSVAPTMFLI